MSPHPIIPLDYMGPQPVSPRAGKRISRSFLVAMLIGTGVSALAWITVWQLLEPGFANLALMVFYVLALKLVVAAACFAEPAWRSAGAGVLTSIPIGILIFFANCVGHYIMTVAS